MGERTTAHLERELASARGREALLGDQLGGAGREIEALKHDNNRLRDELRESRREVTGERAGRAAVTADLIAAGVQKHRLPLVEVLNIGQMRFAGTRGNM